MPVHVPTPHSSADSDLPESDRDRLARELAILVDDFDGTITFNDDVIAAHSHDEAPQPTSGRAFGPCESQKHRRRPSCRSIRIRTRHPRRASRSPNRLNWWS